MNMFTVKSSSVKITALTNYRIKRGALKFGFTAQLILLPFPRVNKFAAKQ